LPANHDIARAVRLAQLQALRRVLKDYEQSNLPEWQADPVNKPKWFMDRALSFVGSQLSLSNEVEVEGTRELANAIEARRLIPLT
jgi:hypothetical protein